MGNMEGQHQRTVDLIESLINGGGLTLHGLLYLLHDVQTTGEDMKRLAEISSTRTHKCTLMFAPNTRGEKWITKFTLK